MKTWQLISLICVPLMILLLVTVGDYGLNEDTPGHFTRGQAYLRLLTSGQSLYHQPRLPSPLMFVPGQRISSYKYNAWESNLAPVRPIAELPGTTLQKMFADYVAKDGRHSFYQHNAWSGQYFSEQEGAGHPPLGDILAAATNVIFYQWLGLTGDIAGYDLFTIFTAVLAVGMITYFTRQVWGTMAAVVAAGVLASYPLFFAESHFNLKDVPELAFFSASLIAFYFFIVRRLFGWFVASTIFFVLAVGTKLNALELIPILGVWLFWARRIKPVKDWRVSQLAIWGVILVFVSLGFFIVWWPWLWAAPFGRLWQVVQFYVGVGSTDLTIQVASPWVIFSAVDLRALILVGAFTPLPTLALLVVGLWATLRRKEWFPHREQVLLLAWLVVPLIRVLRPGADIFGSIRQYMEFLPALVIIAGLGARQLGELVRQRWPHLTILVAGLGFGMMTAWASFILWAYHPNQNVYYNVLVGGLPGALRHQLFDWQTSYGNPYHQAVDWLNKKAAPDAQLTYLDGTMQAISPLWLRSDIHFGSFFSGLEQQGEYVISTVYPQPPHVFEYNYLERFLQPVHEITVGGVPLVKVWKNEASTRKPEYDPSQLVELNFHRTEGVDDRLGHYWEITFDRPYQLLSLSVQLPANGCTRRDGVFKLADWFVPYRHELDASQVEFLFPAELTTKVRFYGLTPQSCFLEGQIINVLAWPGL